MPPEDSPTPPRRRRSLTVEDYVAGVRSGNRAVLGRAITLIESRRPADRDTAQTVLTRLMPHTGAALRVGITGVPGVGKSTFIEKLGGTLLNEGRRVAVLAVDPSSTLSGGSILGDKTRMNLLAADERAFIRPSPTAGTLGGVAARTRETMLLCEAAGFDVVLVETVGVGQSETVVAEMTDFFLALLLPDGGDELQGMKRGLLELVHLVAVNKADGASQRAAQRTAAQYDEALRLMPAREAGWRPPVLTCSAMTGAGLAEIWRNVLAHRDRLTRSGQFAAHRQRQQLRWMWSLVEDALRSRLREHPGVKAALPEIEQAVAAGELPATVAAHRILAAFSKNS